MKFLKRIKEKREKNESLMNNPALIDNTIKCNGCGKEMHSHLKPFRANGKIYYFCKKCITGIKNGNIPEALKVTG